jgi:tetratricopeptide (TPR) repeat protein
MNHPQKPSARSVIPNWVPVLIVFSVALLARCLYLYYYHCSGYWDIMALDPGTHDMLARRIAGGDGMGGRAYFRAPLYIYLLGITYKIFGPGFLAPRIIQALLGSVTACLTYGMAKRLIGSAAALIIGAVAAIYWASIYFDGELLVDGLAIFFAMLALYLLVAGTHQTLPGALLIGIILGLSAISRVNFLAFAAAVIIVKAIPGSSRSSAMMILLGLVLAVMPVTLRNIIRAHDPVLISSQGGINFYMGNNPDADGRTAVVPIPRRHIPSDFLARYQSDPWFKEDVWLSAAYGAERDLGRPLKESGVSSYWYTKSLQWIAGHPLSWLKLMLKKSFFFFHRTEVSNNRDIQYHLEKIPFLKALANLNFGIISPLFIMGLVFSINRIRNGSLSKKILSTPNAGWIWLDLFVITYAASVILFFVNSRYRIPVLPAALILAGTAVSQMAEWNKQKKYLKLAAALAGFFLLLWITNAELVRWNSRPLRAAMHYNLGLALSRQNRHQEAATEFREAVKTKDRFPEAHLALGNALALSGHEQEAINEYHIALIQEPNLADAHYNMALTYMKLDDRERAKQHLKHAHQLAPQMFPAP